MQSRERRRRQVFYKNACRWLLFVGINILLFSPPLPAETEKPTEYDVKAAYLYNFGKFVRWPEASTEYAICIYGSDPIGKVLDSTLEGAAWEGKPVVARRIGNVSDISRCNVLFIGEANREKWQEILTTVKRLPILTVSDDPMFTRHGGMIEFLLSENRIRFEVNLAAADQAGLTLSSQLLKVALRVRRGDER